MYTGQKWAFNTGINDMKTTIRKHVGLFPSMWFQLQIAMFRLNGVEPVKILQ